MSNRKKRRERWGDRYWESAAFNQAAFQIYRDWLLGLAMTRFEWHGLPETCDTRFLEFTLLFQGVATIAKPRGTDKFYSTQAVYDSPINVYDNPTRWRSFGNQGWSFNVNATNGVLVWDNMLRSPIVPTLDWYARELADIERTKQINRMLQKTPMVLTGPQEKANDMLQSFKQVAGGEPVIMGTDQFNDIEWKTIPIDKPFLGEELNADIINTLNKAYNFLGIKSLPRKSERMVAEEIDVQGEPTAFRALDSLTARRMAAQQLNDRFGLDVSVTWRRDIDSENFNFTHSIPRLLDIDDGGDVDEQLLQ